MFLEATKLEHVFNVLPFKRSMYRYIMSLIKNFNDQYTFAKKSVRNAISTGQNIVLYGTSCNGKTHLVNEFNSLIVDNGYCHMFNNLRYGTSSPWILEITNIELLQGELLKQSAFVFINMNGFVYPKYTRLRSGKQIHSYTAST